jgi:alkylation response protein AidB-like acyl-CoA dehydrogenase
LDLLPDAEDEAIIRAVAEYLAGALPVSRLHARPPQAFPAQVREEIGALGWYGLATPAELGGAGFSVLEEALLFREIGRGLGPVEVLAGALAASAAAAHGAEQLSQALMAGRRPVALAFAEPGGRLTADRFTGSLRLVGWTDADLALLAQPQGAALIALDRSGVEARPSLDKSTSLGVTAGGDHQVLVHAPGAELHLRGRLAAAAMLVGIAEAVLAMLVDYARIRSTFGRPIGAYQAVRHPCADMALRCEAARQQLFAAAVTLRDGQADVDLHIASAKLLAITAALKNVDANIQLHGGIGITEEHDAHLFLKRAHLAAQWFGGERELLDEIAGLAA